MDNIDKTTEDMNYKLGTCIENMKDHQKIVRYDAYKEYYTLLIDNFKGDEIENQKFSRSEHLSENIIFLTNLLDDESEQNRLEVTAMLVAFLKEGLIVEDAVIYLLSKIENRVGVALHESEEVKVELLILIKLLINQFGKLMTRNRESLCVILTNLLFERSPEILVATSQCIKYYCDNIENDIQLLDQQTIDCLVTKLSNISSHGRFRVRISAIDALASLGTWGHSGNIKNVVACLVLHTDDDKPQVRLAVVDAAYKLATQMPDRYSYWHLILPCCLVWLLNGDKGVRKAAADRFTMIGEQYEEENKVELQGQVVLDSKPNLYPADDTLPRFRLGCRVLGQSIMAKVIPGVEGDLRDCQLRCRLSTMRLLTALVWLGETRLQQYAPQLLRVLHRAMRTTEDEAVIKEACFCAEVLGHFVLPSCSVPICVEAIRSSADDPEDRSILLLRHLIVGPSIRIVGRRMPPMLEAVLECSEKLCRDVLVQSDTIEFLEQLIGKINLNHRPTGKGYTLEIKDLFGDGIADLGDEATGMGDVEIGAAGTYGALELSIVNAEQQEREDSELRDVLATELTGYQRLNYIKRQVHIMTTKRRQKVWEIAFNQFRCPSQKVLHLLLLIIGSDKCEHNVNRATLAIDVLAKNIHADNTEQFFRNYGAPLMEHLHSTASAWTMADPEFGVAIAFIRLAVGAFGFFPLKLLKLYSIVMSEPDIDAMVQARLLGLLGSLLTDQRRCEGVDVQPLSLHKSLKRYLTMIIDGWLRSYLTSSGGGSRVVLRGGCTEVLGAACTALAIAKRNSPKMEVDREMLHEESDPEALKQDDIGLKTALSGVVPELPLLLQQETVEARLGALAVLSYVTADYPCLLDNHTLRDCLIKGVSDCLDDSRSSSIRNCAAGVLRDILVNLGAYYARFVPHVALTTPVAEPIDPKMIAEATEATVAARAALSLAATAERLIVPALMTLLDDPLQDQRMKAHDCLVCIEKHFPAVARECLASANRNVTNNHGLELMTRLQEMWDGTVQAEQSQ